MVASVLVYLGLLAGLVGTLSLLHPPLLRIPSRRWAGLLVLAGLVAVLVGFAVPAGDHRAMARSTRLDDFVPVWQFGERHTIRVDAPPDRVFAALRGVTAAEITLFRTLTWLRRLGRSGPESILNAPADQPILDVALRSGFIRLAEEPPRELVLGTVVLGAATLQNGVLTPEVYAKPPAGTALAAMNFVVTPDAAGGSLLSTETRVFATDGAARNRFATYWRVILPGSALIRMMWLRAVARRAEQSMPPATFGNRRRVML